VTAFGVAALLATAARRALPRDSRKAGYRDATRIDDIVNDGELQRGTVPSCVSRLHQ